MENPSNAAHATDRQPQASATAPCLIVHPNPLVAEDLRDILTDEGAKNLVVVHALSEAPLDPVRLVVVSGPPETVLASPHASHWSAQDTPVILLNADRYEAQAKASGFHTLAEPFRTEEVTTLLRRLRAFSGSIDAEGHVVD